MVTRNSTKSKTRAVGYLRRSTEKQEQSLADQQREIERYADANGYTILRWHKDDGISGDATEKRRDFQAMHKAACNGRDFDVILVWDQDRFGRFNSMEAGYWIHPLMKAGVRLVTVTEGPINWHDFTGRMIYSMKQEGKHQFLVDLSRNTARGQISIAEQGFLCGQAAPYGYDRSLVDEHGEHRQRVRNGEKFAKPRSWHVKLVPSDDAEKVATAQWLFDQYGNGDVGLRTLAKELNDRCVAGPSGGPWYIGTIREILRNETYTGKFTWAKRRLGKYHRVAAGKIKPRGDDGPIVRLNPVEERIVKPDAHPALVDAELFERVQEKLGERKTRTAPTKAGDAYLLSGIVYCGHCGRKMHGSKKSRRKNGRVYVYPKYICSAYCRGDNTKGCGYHTIDQNDLLAVVLRRLREAVLCGTGREALRKRILAQLEAKRTIDPERVKALRAKLAEHDRDIATGTKRLLRAPDNVADLLANELSTMRRERDRLAGELAELEQPAESNDLAADAERIADRIWELGGELDQDTNPARLREVVRRLVDRIDLHFNHVPRGKRVECPLSRGTIDLRQDQILYGLVSRGDWTPLELFLAGTRALTLQLSIADIEAACGAGKPTSQ